MTARERSRDSLLAALGAFGLAGALAVVAVWLWRGTLASGHDLGWYSRPNRPNEPATITRGLETAAIGVSFASLLAAGTGVLILARNKESRRVPRGD